MNREKILIVDDDLDIRNLIEIYLKNEGYEIVKAKNGKEALELIDDSFDLVLLDVMMPLMDGTTTCTEIRKNYNMPIIFLTAKTEDMDKVIGLTVGADDYITKPFNAIELIARIKANIRRYVDFNVAKREQLSKIITVNDLEINLDTHKVNRSNKEIYLTKTEFNILVLLTKNRGIVFSINKIYDRVWGEESLLNANNTVMVHIRKLREKIEVDPKNPKYIKTIWGVGYKIE
ncbi:response regulator transcription factor [Oceanirhabdus seepicola]|uniref:Stage 0 sporulation protein A homolog n=1 Tax=Oceanirhabdus seepicola TaxID=2828781 RepID=A0A9J6NWA9_9CLOT|nr:response regulator transcription factor [Oceanirhabdus seepicola]MCM1988348.1 response regulator transcription factor [Oceanirhabdus seepicola]